MTRTTGNSLAWLWVTVCVSACGGAGDWQTRLQERFATWSVEHPLMDRAREAHLRALEADQAKNPDAKVWALAADRFLTAAVVRVRNAALEKRVAKHRKERAQLLEDVITLEETLDARFETRRAAERRKWIESAITHSYAHAQEYEAKRFRSRNVDTARLKAARDELTTLALLQLQASRALDSSRSLTELEHTLRQCRATDKHLRSLGCINRARWRIQEMFANARRMYGLSYQDTSRVKKVLQTHRVPYRWQNEALAIVANGVSIATWRKVLAQVRGPLQLHGPQNSIKRVRRRLGVAGARSDRFAASVTDKGKNVVVYLLAYPRATASQPVPGSR